MTDWPADFKPLTLKQKFSLFRWTRPYTWRTTLIILIVGETPVMMNIYRDKDGVMHMPNGLCVHNYFDMGRDLGTSFEDLP